MSHINLESCFCMEVKKEWGAGKITVRNRYSSLGRISILKDATRPSLERPVVRS